MAVTVVQQTNTFDQWRVKTNTIASDLGDAATLNTVATTAVGGVNEVSLRVGLPTNLVTVDKTNTVSAINEVKTAAVGLRSDVGNINNLTGGESDLVTAVNNTGSTGKNFSIAMAIALG
jgi:hypothetical protein